MKNKVLLGFLFLLSTAGISGCFKNQPVQTTEVTPPSIVEETTTYQAANEITTTTAPAPTPAPTDVPTTEEATTSDVVPDVNDFVRVKDYIPDIEVELKYATSDNFTGQVIYDFTEAYLRYGTVLKLYDVQQELKELGYRIKIWDAYRPFSAQERLWEVYPDPVYVANPSKGPGGHNLGGTMDITLVTLTGEEVLMPTGFDDFSTRADRNYSEIENPAAANAQLLQDIMTKHGFKGYYGEWWDYTDSTTYSSNITFTPPTE